MSGYKEEEFKIIKFDIAYNCPYCDKYYTLNNKSDLVRKGFECSCGAYVDFQIDIEYGGAEKIKEDY